MRNSSKGTIALFLLSAALNSSAEIIDLGYITRDTSTGLDWLDLTQTTNRSYDDVSGAFGSGEEFDGYRYASPSEVATLWGNLGSHFGDGEQYGSSVFSSPAYPAFTNAASIIGLTLPGAPTHNIWGAIGITSNQHAGSPRHYVAGRWWDIVTENIVTLDGVQHFGGIGLWWDDSATQSYGSYLVTSSPVPLPATAYLFLSGLVGLVLTKWKK